MSLHSASIDLVLPGFLMLAGWLAWPFVEYLVHGVL